MALVTQCEETQNAPNHNKYNIFASESEPKSENIKTFKEKVIAWFPYLSLTMVNKLTNFMSTSLLTNDEWKILLNNKENLHLRFKELNLSLEFQKDSLNQQCFQNELNLFGRQIVDKRYPNDTFIVNTIMSFYRRAVISETVDILFNEEGLNLEVIKWMEIYEIAPEPSVYINFEYQLKDWFRTENSNIIKFLSFLWAKRLDFNTMKELGSSKENFLASQYLQDFYEEKSIPKAKYFS